MSNAHKVLAEIQQTLKAPKGQFNSFGGYSYRSCEDIVEAVKPLIKEHGATLVLFDEMVNLGDRYYVKATAQLKVGSDVESATGWAREQDLKKGMDQAQITGAASSYARKYALNGLFAIDDTRDADAMDNRGQISGETVDMEKVGKAINYFKTQIDEDDPDHAPANIKKAWERLNNDERLKVQEGLGDKAPGTNRMYKTLLKDYLNHQEQAA